MALVVLVLSACGGSPKVERTSAHESARGVSTSLVTIDTGATQSLGLVVDEGGLIVTAWHSVDKAPALHVRFQDGATHDAVIAAADSAHDIALLRSATHSGDVVPLSDRTAARGDRVYNLTPDHNYDGTVFELKRLSPELEVLEVTGANPKMWNGPVVDDRDQLAGLVAAFVDPPGVVIVVPVKYVRSLLERTPR